MVGFDDNNVAIMGEWMPPSPSPRTFFSSLITDDENKTVSRFPELKGSSENANKNYLTQDSIIGGDDSANNSELKMASRGGLMERMAARAGFNAPRLNTESIRTDELSKKLPEARSPYLTIPPGLSPTTLLDSPVFLTNSLVLPSPTTGKFPFAPTVNNHNSTLMTVNADKGGKENYYEDTSSFAFKPFGESRSFPYFNATNNVHTSQSFLSSGFSIRSNTSLTHPSVEPPKTQTFTNSHSENNRSSNFTPDQTYHSITSDKSPPLDEPREDDGDRRSSGDPNVQAEDGYNWRKYGQKQVKGSEFPRSYYKCTHPNCPVKKKVERSHEGHITEIIYKGAHNHVKPPPNRRLPLGSSIESEQGGAHVNGEPSWSAMQRGGGPDWSREGTSEGQLAQEYGNGDTLRAQNGPNGESGDGVDGSCTFSNEEEDRATHGSVSLGYDGEGEESESKRRRIEAYASEISGATRAIREPRVVVQTTSDVDILDDGYRWRKYGQKVVKGNPNPRSYYKCTSSGCNVRKHVERASHDLKSVITTYEGKHNHDVPAARNSSHVNSGGGLTTNMLASQQPSAASSHNIHRPEPSQAHSSTARFERPALGSYGLPGGLQMGPGLGYGFGISQSGLGNLDLPAHHPFLGHHYRPMNNNMSFMMPKPEPKMEPVMDSGLSNSDAASIYQQLMSRLPPGPQM